MDAGKLSFDTNANLKSAAARDLYEELKAHHRPGNIDEDLAIQHLARAQFLSLAIADAEIAIFTQFTQLLESNPALLHNFLRAQTAIDRQLRHAMKEWQRLERLRAKNPVQAAEPQTQAAKIAPVPSRPAPAPQPAVVSTAPLTQHAQNFHSAKVAS